MNKKTSIVVLTISLLLIIGFGIKFFLDRQAQQKSTGDIAVQTIELPAPLSIQVFPNASSDALAKPARFSVVDGKVNEESVITWTLDVAHAANGSKASIGTAGEHKHALSIFDAAGEQVALLKPESELSRIYAVSWSPDSARVAYQVNTSVSIDASSTPVSFTHKIILFDVTTGTAQTVASGVSPSFLDDGSLVYLDDMGRVVRRDAMENASTTVLVDRGTEDVGANDTLVVTPHAEQLIVSRPSAFDVVTYAKAKDATTYAKLAEYKDKEMFAPTLSPNGKEVYFLTTVGSSPNRTVSVGALDIASGSFRTVFPLAFPPQSYAFLTWGK